MRHDHSDRTSHTRGNARIARSKGAASGLLLVLLGVWAGAIPFVGPYFDFGYTPNSTWTWTSARFWYEVLPAIVTIVGALLMIASANRALAAFGGWAAAVSGAWLIIGPVLAPELGLGTLGRPINGGWVGIWESIGLFFGVGALILYIGSTAVGRMSVKGVRDVRAAERRMSDDGAAYGPADGNGGYTGDPVSADGRGTDVAADERAGARGVGARDRRLH